MINPNHKHGTYIEQHTAPSTSSKNTQTTVEQSSKNYENNGYEGYITRLPKYVEISKTGKKVRVTKE